MLSSIPRGAIVSIQPDPMGPFELMNVNTAEEMLNSRHVGGIKRRTVKRKGRGGAASLVLVNTCGPGCIDLRGGSRKSRRNRKNLRKLYNYRKSVKS